MSVVPREGGDPGTLLHMGRPLAASSPAARAAPPTLYAHYTPEQMPFLPPISYPRHPLPPPSTLTATLPKSYPRELCDEGPYAHEVLAALPPPYTHFHPSLTLGRAGSLSSGRATPSCSSTTSSSANHHGSTSTVAFHPENESPRGPQAIPRDQAGSPSQRESSV
ncbi:hypothetical protein E2C01_047737 [Portunus trituberculatus]|uniref:Uncharacterized protein n=1 Tax=Portunus trituberculatus TaxID=210409 RepID=A0A5B7G8P4_PORTR|nr:hypothetical protein [Portunus trituberculatus]